jgi:hypothetical protein
LLFEEEEQAFIPFDKDKSINSISGTSSGISVGSISGQESPFSLFWLCFISKFVSISSSILLQVLTPSPLHNGR